jgi:Fe-S-cluster containining protein
VDEGLIPAHHLFTIRQGERVRDNVKSTLVWLGQEIVKIKGANGRWTCAFFEEASKGCRIYDARPLECRVLNCRETGPIEALYERTRLTRRDLLAGVGGLWEVILDHERRCSYARIARLLGDGFENGVPIHAAAIQEMIRFDFHIRQLTVEKAGMDGRMLDFLFGRPLTDTLKMFDVNVHRSSFFSKADLP